MQTSRGFFMIGVVSPGNTLNIGTLVRSAHVFGASGVFAVGSRFPVDNESALSFDRHVPVFYYDSAEQFDASMPRNAELVLIEMSDDARSLHNFVHPERAIYALGSEYTGMPREWFDLRENAQVVRVPTRASVSLNVAIAGSIVMADRVMKEEAKRSRREMFSPRSNLRPTRGRHRRTPPPDPA